MRGRRVILLVLVAAVVAATDYWWVRGLQHWAGKWSGDTNVSGPQYGFWSGFGSVVIPPVLQGISFAVVFAWHNNCHHKGCWRVSRHQVDGRSWCHRHHSAAREAAAPVVSPLEQRIDVLAESIDGLAEAVRVAFLAGRRP